MDFQPTYGNFEVKGIVTGLSGGKTKEGNKNGYEWKRLELGIKVDHNAFVYTELFGTKDSKVKMVFIDPATKRYDRSIYRLVDSEDVNDTSHRGYKAWYPVQLNLDESGSDVGMTNYKAIEHLLENLNDGDSVLVKGSIHISKYEDRIQERYSIRNVYKIEDVDFDEFGYEPEAYFVHDVVYVDLIKLDKNKYSLSTKIIYKDSDSVEIVPYDFVINDTGSSSTSETVQYLRNNIEFGTTLKVHGNIKCYVPIDCDEQGNKFITGSAIKELEVTGGNISSIVVDRYSKEDFEYKEAYRSPFDEEEEEIKDNSPF